MPRITTVADWASPLREEPRVLEVKFGDGYSQRTEDGMNTILQNWSVGFKNRTKATIDELAGFLRSMNAVTAFDFPLPGESWAVVDSGFGVGDGVRTQFQLQRPGMAARTDSAWEGSFPTYTKPRTNLVASDDLTSWTGLAPSANVATGPAGGHTADMVAGNGVASSSIISPNLTSDGAAYCFSMFAKNVPGQPASNFSWGLRNTTDAVWYIGPLNIVLTNDWARYFIATGVTTAAKQFNVHIYPGGTGANTLQVLVAKMQLEKYVTAATRPIVGAANTVATPAYYPLTTEGFVPASGWASRPTIYKDGVAQNDLLSVYTLNNDGSITFAAAPAAGVVLSFTGGGEVVKRVLCRNWNIVPEGFNNYSITAEFNEVLA